MVTAQKREQSLQDVPLAVSAISGNDMLEAGINDIRDLSRQVPSLQVQSSTSAAAVNYRLRRVGNIGNIPTFEPAVGVFQDGAYRSRPLFTTGDLFDVDRVEILRGPQSTLYGKNTTAGVVAVYTKAPAESFEGNAQADLGQIEGASDAPLYRFVGGVSGPRTETLGASLGMSATLQDHTDEGALSEDRPDATDLDRRAMVTKLAPVTVESESACPTWEWFVDWAKTQKPARFSKSVFCVDELSRFKNPRGKRLRALAPREGLTVFVTPRTLDLPLLHRAGTIAVYRLAP